MPDYILQCLQEKEKMKSAPLSAVTLLKAVNGDILSHNGPHFFCLYRAIFRHVTSLKTYPTAPGKENGA